MNKPINKFLIISGLLLVLSISGAKAAAAQNQLTKSQVAAALNAKLERGLSGPDIWNTGYDFYRLYPPTPETARQIHLGFSAARGLSAQQKNDLGQAADYWLKIAQKGPTRVTAGRETWRPDPYYIERKHYLGSPLRMSRPSQPGPYGKSFRPTRSAPPQANPYPGPYYPGTYPP